MNRLRGPTIKKIPVHMIDQYIYFQTDSGFNDMLTCLNNVLNYCKKYNRKILLDTLHSSFRVNLSEYFDILDPYIIYNIDTIRTICEHESSILPDVGADTLNQYLNGDRSSTVHIKNMAFANRRKLLTCDTLPKHEVPQKILLLLDIVGGGPGYPMFKIFNLHWQ